MTNHYLLIKQMPVSCFLQTDLLIHLKKIKTLTYFAITSDEIYKKIIFYYIKFISY